MGEGSIRILPGQYFDKKTGLAYNYFRDYDPQTGRYVQSDPIGLAGGINPYLYSNVDPVNRRDPLGLWSTEVHHFMIDAFFGSLGMSASQITAIKKGSDDVDAVVNQFSNAERHAMRDNPRQSISRQREKACAYIAQNLDVFSKYRQSPSHAIQDLAYQSLGRAMHTVMDSTSPAHSGFRAWDFTFPWRHGSIPLSSKEGMGDLTPELMDLTVVKMRQILRNMDCSCVL